uniref:NADH dehydrogenase subunit 6 n=1 Tax=Amblyomma parvitarsum TaxID=260089 RepID=UPI002E79509E|nr:NADH dehydrogenase subunit 6 [Amblyomma parvitarsum]WQF69041.1 NADH dehydrogenase subunit 6 [Amblyomma parvitarsum]
MKMILLFSILLISFSHPMMMLMSVILLTLFISMIFYKNTENSLFSLMTILLILGGMLIIFMYMVSLCPNKKMKINFKFIFMALILFVFNSSYLYINFSYQNLIKIYYFSFLNILMMMMMYLLISLVVIMKNLNWISCPMKSF